MNWWLAALLLSSAETASARMAVVAALSGQVYQGQLRLTSQHLVLANAEQDLWLHLPATNVAWFFLEPPPPSPTRPAGETVAESWKEEDIGLVTLRGDSHRRADAVTVRSSGLGIRGPSDSFHFVFRPAQADTEIIARVTATHQTAPTAQAGVMMRESLGGEGRCAMLGLNPARGGFFLWRDQEAARPQIQAQPDLAPPCWVKLKREGNEFSAYKSRNGRQWALAGKATVAMRENFYVGLATASGRDYALNWSSFDKVRAGPSLMNVEFPPRAELVSGSVVVGWPVSGPGDALDLRGQFTDVTVPLRSVSRLIFQWTSPDWLAAARRESRGVWLSNGEFVEGEFRSVAGGKLRISSVLYGMKNLDGNNEVAIVALQRGTPRPARFEVKTVNGSVWRAVSFAFGENELILKEPALGTVTVPIHELAALQRL